MFTYFFEGVSHVLNNPVANIVLFLFLGIATYTDLKYLKIYNKFNLSLLIIRLLFLITPMYNIPFSIQNIFSSIFVFTVLLIFGVIFMHKMGGDIKFLTVFMLFFDFKFSVIFMATCSISNLVYVLILKRYLKIKKTKLAKMSQKQGNCDIIKPSLIDKINCHILKFSTNKKVEVKDIVSINMDEFEKFKMPFAPFFLISYTILFSIYYFVVK